MVTKVERCFVCHAGRSGSDLSHVLLKQNRKTAHWKWCRHFSSIKCQVKCCEYSFFLSFFLLSPPSPILLKLSAIYRQTSKSICRSLIPCMPSICHCSPALLGRSLAHRLSKSNDECQWSRDPFAWQQLLLSLKFQKVILKAHFVIRSLSNGR